MDTKWIHTSVEIVKLHVKTDLKQKTRKRNLSELSKKLSEQKDNSLINGNKKQSMILNV